MYGLFVLCHAKNLVAHPKKLQLHISLELLFYSLKNKVAFGTGAKKNCGKYFKIITQSQ